MVGGEHDPEGRKHDVEALILERQSLGVGLPEGDWQAVGGGALLVPFEKGLDVIGGGHLGEMARRGQRGIAIAGSDIEHPLAGLQVDGLAEALADELQLGADHGVVAGGRDRLLAGLDGCIVWSGNCRRHRISLQLNCSTQMLPVSP